MNFAAVIRSYGQRWQRFEVTERLFAVYGVHSLLCVAARRGGHVSQRGGVDTCQVLTPICLKLGKIFIKIIRILSQIIEKAYGNLDKIDEI